MDRQEAIAMMQVYKEELAQRADNIKYDIELMSIYLAQIKAFDMAIEALQTKVVRCKDCRFWKNEHLCLVMSRYGSINTKAEHYCSWGERREP